MGKGLSRAPLSYAALLWQGPRMVPSPASLPCRLCPKHAAPVASRHRPASARAVCTNAFTRDLSVTFRPTGEPRQPGSPGDTTAFTRDLSVTFRPTGERLGRQPDSVRTVCTAAFTRDLTVTFRPTDEQSRRQRGAKRDACTTAFTRDLRVTFRPR